VSKRSRSKFLDFNDNPAVGPVEVSIYKFVSSAGLAHGCLQLASCWHAVQELTGSILRQSPKT
jgi:hypothetical protein